MAVVPLFIPASAAQGLASWQDLALGKAAVSRCGGCSLNPVRLLPDLVKKTNQAERQPQKDPLEALGLKTSHYQHFIRFHFQTVRFLLLRVCC